MSIKCNFYNYELKKFKQFEFDCDLNMYPCCHYYTTTYSNNQENFLDEFKKIDNSVINNSIAEIEEKFNEMFNEEVWSDDTKCPLLCKKLCSI